jgi:hypothetical protein
LRRISDLLAELRTLAETAIEQAAKAFGLFDAAK